jgi:hypothetical protein
VQAAASRHHRFAGALVQVVGVREQDLRAGLGELVGRDAAHRAVGRDRHEGRGLDRAVRSDEPSGARVGVVRFQREGKGRGSRRAGRHQVTSIASP